MDNHAAHRESPGCTRQQHRRQQIMQAAERLFTSRRFHEITMEAVAAEAKVAKGTLYSYFSDKDELFFETATSGLEELCELLGSIPKDVSFSDRLLQTCRQISGFYDRRRELLRMMQTEDARMSQYPGALRQRWIQKRKALLSAIASVFADGAAKGQVRSDLPPEVLASMLMGMLRSWVHDLADGPITHRRHEVIVDLILNGSGNNRSTRDEI